MKAAVKSLILLIILGLASRAHAQGPRIAGIASVVEASVGYSYTQATIPSEGHLPMMGPVLSATKGLSPRFGVKLQAGYVRSFDAFQTGRSADILTYMAGPVIYPIRKRKYDVHAQILFGGARETGVNFENDGTLIRGYVNHAAWAGGAGFQVRLSNGLSLRPEIEYLNTSFFDSNVTVRSQSNLRASVSLAFTLGRRE